MQYDILRTPAGNYRRSGTAGPRAICTTFAWWSSQPELCNQSSFSSFPMELLSSLSLAVVSGKLFSEKNKSDSVFWSAGHNRQSFYFNLPCWRVQLSVNKISLITDAPSRTMSNTSGPRKKWHESKHLRKRAAFLLEDPDLIPTDVCFRIRTESGKIKEVRGHK